MIEWGLSVLRLSSPLMLAAYAGLWSERSGVIHIAIEGQMLMGAFAAATVTHFTQSPELGLLAGMVSGAAVGGLYGVFVLWGKADQIIAGMAVNFLMMGSIPLLGKALFGVTGSTPSLPQDVRLTSLSLLGVVGVCALFAWLYPRLLVGLWNQFAGEHPKALEAVGVSPLRVRWASILFAGLWAGAAGALLSIFLSSSFSRGMSGGRGFIALAALIFGKWKPVPTMLACIFFGAADAVQMRLQGSQDAWIPVQFIQILPYVVTLFVLAGWVGVSRAPKALGRALAVVLAFSNLTGCARVAEEWEGMKAVLQGARSPFTKPNPPRSQDSTVPGPKPLSRERLGELFYTLFERPMPSREFLLGHESASQQGASLEGLYRGWIRSKLSIELETKGNAASKLTQERFLRLWEITRELAGSDPVLRAHSPRFQPLSYGSVHRAVSTPLTLEQAPRALLVRELAEWVLEIWSARSLDGQRFSESFSHWAVAIQATGFLSEVVPTARKNPERAFHLEWALQAYREGRREEILGEILVRIHLSLKA